MKGPAGAKEAWLEVLKDPRLDTTQSDFVAQFDLLLTLNDKLSDLRQAVNRIRRLNRQLAALGADLQSDHEALAGRCTSLARALTDIEEALLNRRKESPRDVLRHPAGLNETIADLMWLIAMADAKPTDQSREVAKDLMARLEQLLDALGGLVREDLAALNADLASAGVAAIRV